MKPSILIVDDDPLSLSLLRKYLNDGGYKVCSAGTGKKAMRLLHQKSLSIVITDWMMPEMDGLQLCRDIRQADGIAFIYIIILTVHSDRDHLLQAFDAGADDFLTKPLDSGELLARLKPATRIVELEEDLAFKNRQLHKANAELAILNERLDRIATTDELTGLCNRRQALLRIEEYVATARRSNQALAVVMLDIDHFKRFNDTHGHDVGDVVLRQVARIFQDCMRAGETVFRLGGEEFFIICPNATAEAAAALAERVRERIDSFIIQCGDLKLHATISAGVAEFDASMEGWKELLKCADDQLYKAKRSGRNRVCVPPAAVLATE